MKRLQISPRAQADLDDIWHYIAEDSLESADAMLASLLASARLLTAQPNMGPSREDLAPGLRSFSAQGYLIFYSPTPDRIRIERFLHGRREIKPGIV